MTLAAVPGGWVNSGIWIDEMTEKQTVAVERKSKFKHKVIFNGISIGKNDEMLQWCTTTFGPGGRSKKLRWRFGWTDKTDTFYFKDSADATLFMMKWA